MKLSNMKCICIEIEDEVPNATWEEIDDVVHSVTLDAVWDLMWGDEWNAIRNTMSSIDLDWISTKDFIE